MMHVGAVGDLELGPVRVTSGVFGQGDKSFIEELGCYLQVKTGEPQSHHHLLQRIAVAM